LVMRPMESLARINHFAFAGHQDFGPETRALAAGAGVGDEVLYLAEQLRDRGAELVYLDSSAAALAICQGRAAARGLNNIEYRLGLIEDLDPEKSGVYDYIHCVGVLDQLSDPALGLRRLVGVLAPEGGMGLAARSALGVGADQALRDLFRFVGADIDPVSWSHQEALALIAALKPDHPCFRGSSQDQALDDFAADPGRLLERLLTPPDSGFSVGGVHDLVESSGLEIVEFVPTDMTAPLFTLFYDPDFYSSDAKLARRFADLSTRRRREIAELLNGGMAAHGCYVVRPGGLEATPADEDVIPSLSLAPSAFQVSGNSQLVRDYEGRRYEFEATPSTQLMFHLINGEKTVGEIVAEGNRLLQQVGLPASDLMAIFQHLFASLRSFGWITLRHRSVRPFVRLDHLFYEAAGWIPPTGGAH